jgi:uncharacterized membrane protein YeiH
VLLPAGLVPNSAVQLALDLLGIFVAALTGGLVGVRRRLDLFGVLVLAVVTGLGGGIIRDLLIGRLPPWAFDDWRYGFTATAAGLIAFALHPAVGRVPRTVAVLDAFVLGTFCVTGAVRALAAGLGLAPAALLGMVTAVGGGVLRDVLAGDVPAVLRSGDLYAVPALLGSVLVVVSARFGVYSEGIAFVAVALTVALRLGALRFGWRAPYPRGAGDQVRASPTGEDRA